MPPLGPIKRNDLVRYLKMLGFEGPYSGGKHQFIVKADLRLTISNPHKGDISKALLTKILRQADISKDAWEKLR